MKNKFDVVPTFPGLPKIPIAKTINKTRSPRTTEQKIMTKILAKHEPTQVELNVLQKINHFYEDLRTSLKELQWSCLGENDLESLQEYIRYVFYYNILINASISIDGFYRAVRNKSITGLNDSSIYRAEQLSYAPLNIVNDLKSYNRVTTYKNTVFYGSETFDTVIRELKPKTNERISIGHWKYKNRNPLKVAFVYGLDPSNKLTNDAYLQYQYLLNNTHPTVASFMRNYFELLFAEFSKEVSDHREYLVSSVIGEDILGFDKEDSVEVLVYPSVMGSAVTNNYAVNKRLFDDGLFQLTKVTELVVGDTKYTSFPTPRNTIKETELISCIEVKERKSSQHITNLGEIEW